MIWDAFKSYMRGEYITRISASRWGLAASLEALEAEEARLEAAYVEVPDQAHYVACKDSLCGSEGVPVEAVSSPLVCLPYLNPWLS